MPQMQFSTEVLPAPFGPISARSTPLLAWNDTSCRTASPPNDRETFSNSSSAIPTPATAVLLHVAVAAALPAAGAQVELADVLVRAQPLRRAVEDDAPVLHHVPVVRHLERHLRVLLHDEQRDLQAVPDHAQALHELANHERRETQGELVDEQQLRRAHEGGGDAEHLALAAGKVAGFALREACELRKILVRRLLGEALAAHGGLQVLVDRQVLEDLAALRDQRGAEARHPMRRPVLDALAIEDDGSFGHPCVVESEEARDRA